MLLFTILQGGRLVGVAGCPVRDPTSSMVFVVYPVNYFIIYFIIKAIFTEKYRIKYLKTRAYLLDYLYKIQVILAVRV